MNTAPTSQSPWRLALRQPVIWRRSAAIGLGVGALQVVVNQGDHWLHHQVNAAVVAKTVISPLITFFVALLSAAGSFAEKNKSL